MNDVNDQVFAFRFGRQPTSLQFDPNNDIVLKQGSTTVGATLSMPTLLLPTSGAIHIPLTTPLIWNEAISAATYHLQLATDNAFSNIVVDDSTLTDTSRQVGPLAALTQYYWRVNAKNAGGISAWSTPSIFTTMQQTGVSTEPNIPGEFSLSQNYPNPFNPTTVITYGLPQTAHVNLAVFNMLGQQVALLDNGERTAGYHDVVFDGNGLASGVYVYRIQAGDFVQTRKLVLMK